MGIKTVTLANGQVKFEADVRIKGVDRQTATFDDKKAAERFIQTVTRAANEAKLASATHRLAKQALVGGHRTYSRAKLSDVVMAFRESPKCSKRCGKSLSPVAELVESATVEGATEDWTEAYVARARSTQTHIGTVYSYATIKSQLESLTKAVKWWARQNGIREPLIEISTACFPTRWENKRERRLEEGEYDRIINQIRLWPSCNVHWRCLVDLCLETGARLQELVLAEWSEITRNDQLWIMPAEHTKKKKARRVPLSGKARAVLAELRSIRQADDPRLFHVFASPHYVSHYFRLIIKAADLVDLRFHDLRHEAISRMCIDKPKAPVKALMEIVGHQTYEAFTRYSHLRDHELIGLLD